jgi:putative MATE family efflux protein
MPKSENRLILALAIPAVLQTVIKSSFTLSDAYWVGKLGSVQLAAISVATFLVWGMMSLGEMIATGTNALVAQSTGAKNNPLSAKISIINIVNAFFYSLILGNLAIPLTPYLYDLIHLDAQQRFFADEYFHTILYGFPAFIMLSTLSAAFRGYGDTKTPFYLLLFAAVLNFVLNPVLIFGIKLGSGEVILNYGIKGSALVSIISYFIAFLIGFYILLKRKLADKISSYTFNKKIISDTFKIGFPLGINGVAFSMIYVFVASFVAEYGSVGLAALGIGHRSESLAYQCTVGFALAATIMVGQSIGAGFPEKAQHYTWKILKLSGAFVIPYALFLFIFSADIAAIFSQDAGVIQAASDYNKLAAVVLFATALDVILSGAFSGAGDTVPPAVISFTFNIIRIPLCFLFSPIWGLNGVWIAICLSALLKGIAITIWFKLGTWKTRGVRIS